MRTFNLRFGLSEIETQARFTFLGEVDLDVDSSGHVTGLWLDGEDFSEHGEVIDAVLLLIGRDALQRRLSEMASVAPEVDGNRIAKGRTELDMEFNANDEEIS